MPCFMLMSNEMVMEGHLLSRKFFCSAGTGVYNIFSIAQILDESFIDPMFVELDGMS